MDCGSGACSIPGFRSCVIIGSSLRVELFGQYLIVRWAPPTGSPADFPLSFTYVGSVGSVSELGNRWAATYQRFAEPQLTINPVPVNVNTPTYSYPESDRRRHDAALRPQQPPGRDDRSPGPAHQLWLRRDEQPGPHDQSHGPDQHQRL